ncbi:hypothetical protein [Siminovitchia fortis]|uniref:hypothetical protein n=1 Tax=Siminovitchia fortis TaxID=254758 RepID=UPI0011A1D15E|nr:hypothetical protein [Siminovitchia fortis]
MSKLLIQEHPLLIIPTLAVKLGLNEAVVLQQMHYWLMKSRHTRNKRKWVYNTYREWQEQLPFWSESTVKRTIKSLEKKGLVVSGTFNRSKMDQTKWYTLDYEKLAEMVAENQIGLTPVPDDMTDGSSCPEGEVRLTKPIPETTSKTTTENIYIPLFKVVDYLNEQTGSSYY